MNKDDYYPFSEGMPTGPDVEMIMKAYPDAKPGSKIPREALYELLGLDGSTQRGYNRLRSVMSAFEHRMKRDKGFVVDFDADAKAYRVCTPSEVMANTPRVIEKIKRRARRQRLNLASVAAHATDSERPVVEHQARVLHVMEREAKKSNMNLLPPTAAAPAPQIAPPQKKNGDKSA